MDGNTRKYLAEVVRHVRAGAVRCAAIGAEGFRAVGAIGFIGIGMAFGMTVLAMAYALGPISGGHFNPAVTAAVWAAGR